MKEQKKEKASVRSVLEIPAFINQNLRKYQAIEGFSVKKDAINDILEKFFTQYFKTH